MGNFFWKLPPVIKFWNVTPDPINFRVYYSDTSNDKHYLKLSGDDLTFEKNPSEFKANHEWYIYKTPPIKDSNPPKDTYSFPTYLIQNTTGFSDKNKFLLCIGSQILAVGDGSGQNDDIPDQCKFYITPENNVINCSNKNVCIGQENNEFSTNHSTQLRFEFLSTVPQTRKNVKKSKL